MNNHNQEQIELIMAGKAERSYPGSRRLKLYSAGFNDQVNKFFSNVVFVRERDALKYVKGKVIFVMPVLIPADEAVRLFKNKIKRESI